jgi:hypothetical protein
LPPVTDTGAQLFLAAIERQPDQRPEQDQQRGHAADGDDQPFAHGKIPVPLFHDPASRI